MIDRFREPTDPRELAAHRLGAIGALEGKLEEADEAIREAHRRLRAEWSRMDDAMELLMADDAGSREWRDRAQAFALRLEVEATNG